MAKTKLDPEEQDLLEAYESGDFESDLGDDRRGHMEASEKDELDWAERTRADLEQIYRETKENHPGAVDEQNPGFNDWLETGYQKALESARLAREPQDAQNILSRYLAGFADGHFGLSFYHRAGEAHWAGIWLAREGEDYIVRHRADQWPTPLPGLGDTLVACDGRGAEEILRNDVLANVFDEPELSFPKNHFAHHLLIKRGEGPRHHYRQCEFKTPEGERQVLPLTWKPYDASLHHPWYQHADQPAVFELRKVGDAYWIRLGTFMWDESALQQYKQLLADLEQLENPDTLVFDLRLNNGGSSVLGEEVLKAIYGEQTLRALLQPLEQAESASQALWRVSEGNYRHIVDVILPMVEQQTGRQSDYYTLLAGFAKTMQAALEQEETFVVQPTLEEPSREESEKPAIIPNALPRVYALTDHGCGSACLDFMDVVMALPNSTHLGKETFADSNYMEVRYVDLQSGLGKLVLPQKVYRNRPRGHNESYQPDHEYRGDIYETEAVREWVLGLTEKGTGSAN